MKQAIAAISTAQAPGGIGIVRISGEDSIAVAEQVFKPVGNKKLSEMKGYNAVFGEAFAVKTGMSKNISKIKNIKENDDINTVANTGISTEKIDDAIALVFRAPKSYTGEDVVELSCHGGLYVTKRLLEAVLQAGARPALAGEFTKQAFLNGKMDLTQAESVMGIISAGSEQAMREAVSGGEGRLSRRMNEFKLNLKDLAAHLAAWADFPDEDIPQVEENKLAGILAEIKESISSLLSNFETGRILREGVSAVIAGKTNAGKSTLMNLLSGCERSIVTNYEGTTRDVVEETVLLGDVPLRLQDTAGIREADDPVEKIGIERSIERMQAAQLVFAVFDASRELDTNDCFLLDSLNPENTVAVMNKTDLPPQIEREEIIKKFPCVVEISAETGSGLADLEKAVADLLNTGNYDPSVGSLYTQRQKQDAQDAFGSISQALEAQQMGMTLDAVTVCVEDALEALCRLTGERVSDAVVDEVFSKFCVGK